MPQLFAGIGAQPILPVQDLESAMAHYTGIGFGGGWTIGAPPTVAGLALDGVQLRFELTPVPFAPQKVWIRMAGLQPFYESASELGAKIISEPKAYAHGFTEFTLEDQDGHQLVFAEATVKESLNRDHLEQVDIEFRKLTPEEHKILSDAVGWGPLIYRPNVPDQISRLTATAVAHHAGKLVGAASLAGDGRFIHIMGDVMVLPEFQGRGVGKKLIEALGGWLKENGAKNAFVCLFASENQAGYYRQFGFSGPETGFVGMSKVLVENDDDGGMSR